MINNQQYIFNRQVPKKRYEYEHTMEDADDTPAYAKSTLSGVSTPFRRNFTVVSFGIANWVLDDFL